jgi:hypothetical protein
MIRKSENRFPEKIMLPWESRGSRSGMRNQHREAGKHGGSQRADERGLHERYRPA